VPMRQVLTTAPRLRPLPWILCSSFI